MTCMAFPSMERDSNPDPVAPWRRPWGQTRRRLRGRQPLCGIGVTSRIEVTLKPAAWIARSADSRPEPGPETSTSSVRMPCSEAFLTASSAAIWAANGVDLREPLNPMVPAEDQEIVLPCASVMVIIVLLNVEFTWATPDTMFFRSRRRTRVASLAIGSSFNRANGAKKIQIPGDQIDDHFFLPAIALALPLRVRALVCVRWPRTGNC